MVVLASNSVTWVSAGAVFDLTGGASYTLGGSYTGSGAGTVRLDGTLTVAAAGATVNLPGSLLQWTSGTLTGGTLTNTGALTISGSSSRTVIGGTLSNAGAVSRSGAGALTVQSGGAINNQAGGVFDFLDDSGITNGGGSPAPSFSNASTVRKSGGSGTSSIGIAFNGLDGGILDAQSGTLGLALGGSFNGVTAVTAANGTAALTNGTFVARAGASLGTAGALTVTGNGILSVNAGDTAYAQHLLLDTNGVIAGAGTLAVPSGGTMTWTSAGGGRRCTGREPQWC